MISENKILPKRKRTRLKGYDYSLPGSYFITICTKDKKHLLSEITVGQGLAPAENRLTIYGFIAKEQIEALEKSYNNITVDKYVIMPNHIHVILILNYTAGDSQNPTITDIICAYKSLTTRECKKVRPVDKLFQTSFYEHVIRGREDYEEISEYIVNNPKQWELDNLYSEK